LLEDLAVVLDTSEQFLRDADYVLPVRTSNALLGVKRLGERGDAKAELGPVEAATALLKGLSARHSADPRLHVNVAVRFDDAIIQTHPGGEADVIGGPLLALEAWVPETNVTEVRVSRGAAAEPRT
jgi:hypothetical protein